MKLLFQRSLAALLFATLLIAVQPASSQTGVLNPADPVVEYDSQNRPTQPPSGQIKDWVRTSSMNWNTELYKAYIYKGHIFRLKFPKTYQHNVNDGKVYPMMVFFHGLGEAAAEDEIADLYDNEYHLLHGGQRHKDSVESGKFDGFLLYLQNQWGFFGNEHYDVIAELINNFFVPQIKLDINRIFVDGLSGGGTASWEFAIRYPRLTAACLPISASHPMFGSSANVNILKYIPIWHFQGGQDKSPDPITSEALGAAILNAGGSYRYTKYPNRGHSCWNDAWSDPDFHPFMLRAHKANPIPMFGKYEFCVGESVNLTLGLTAGFDGYQWRKNGVVIPTATSNTYLISGSQAATFGTYDCRIRRGTVWSVWSPSPIVVKLKAPTTPPPIQISGLFSKVIPAPDGNTGVTLKEPLGYLTYSWTRVGNSTVLGTVDSFRATTPGDYVVKVTEQFGCLSEFSAPFTVINANGPNKPDPASNVILTAVSMSQMKVDWSDNPNPAFNETNFEVYQGTQAGGPYTLVGITNQDITTFTMNGLSEGTTYYYIIRAVNNTGAAAPSAEVNKSTTPDNQAPTAPGNLRITATTNNSVALAWNASTDNVGVFAYDIIINGINSYVTSSTSFTCFNLSTADSGYLFIVKARDAAGNISVQSNQVFGIPPVIIPPAPSAPTNIVATAVSYKRIDLTWTDNSSNETGFQILRSLNSISGFASVGTVAANTTAFVDSTGLNAATTYYYRVRALYAYGGSSLIGEPQANWKFNNTYTDASVNNKGLTNVGTTFDAADKMEGTHSVNFNGTSQYIDVTTASNDYIRGGYAAKSVTFWMKSLANTGNRIVFDLGGNDDGLAVRLDANTLFAGVASNNARFSLSTPFTSAGWNHVALVYSANTFRLYLNGTMVASNLALSFTSVGTTSNGSRIGTVNSTNPFNAGTGFFSGKIDDFGIYDVALTQDDITRLINNTIIQGNATTLAAPAIPVVPSALTATGVSSSSNNISWTDNSDNESNFKLYKSDDNNTNYILLATLPANTTSFVDGGLYASSIRYYKVNATSLGGESVFSNEDSAKTLGFVPIVTSIVNRYMRYGTQLQVDVHATSPLNGNITFSFNNLPSFASFAPGSNGNGVLTFNNPSSGQQGTYANITVIATDPFGSGSTAFQLVVNDNYSPELPAISNVTINEKQTSQLNLAATDQNPGDVLTWTFTGLPSFVGTILNSGSAQLNLAPGYADHGVYPVTVKVDDGNNGTVTRSFNITVNDVYPSKRIYINFTDGSLPIGAPWNSTNKQPALNDNFANFTDETGAVTPIGLRILTAWGSIGNGSNVLGVNTGNNSGLYPDAVIRSAYWTDAAVQNMSIYGLDVTQKYSFTFFGSRGNVADNRTSTYTVKGISVNLNAANNTQNTVGISNVVPDAGGTLGLTLARAAGSNFAYLNAMVIETAFDDGTAPAKPRNVAAQLLPNNTARLTWIDAAYNETAYQVYRATNAGGPFTLLNPAGNNANIQLYDNANLGGNQTYYYTVRTVNSYGNSNYSDTVFVTTNNGTPVMNTIANVTLRIQEVADVNISVTDDAGDVITLSATNLPPFATLTDNGNGTGVIHIAPGSSVGIFTNVTVTAKDASNATASRVFRIVVRDVFNSIYVNFSNTPTLVGPSPWNNFNSVPFANKSLTNMIDDSETPTGVSITQLDTWEGAVEQGAVTGNNTGVFPDVVMQTVYYQSSTTPMRLRIAGLNTVNTKYNLVFFASRLAGDNRSTVYTANGQSVTLNAANNIANTVQINGLVPDASGIIEFNCLKAVGSAYAYLGAVVIQSYIDDGTPFAPSNLVAVARSKTSIDLKWSDKSSDEEGFEVYRAEALGGPYTLVTTTAASVTSYLNNSGLLANKTYYYKVRGKKADVYSGYTNVVSTSTFIYTVLINFNRQNNQSSPWNNTARAPEEGRVFSNLRNDLNNSSGINMTIVDNFSGDNPFGVITGNNSGVFPDNVIRSSWWVDVGIIAKLKISNLNQNLQYTFIFCGSRDGGGDRTSVYNINGKSVSLNAAFNSTQTVQIDNVRPDVNGEAYITIAPAQYALFAYLNGMTINAYKVGDVSGGGGGVGGRVHSSVTSLEANYSGSSNVISKLGGFPNPFTNQITVSANFAKPQARVTLRMLDINGRIVYSKEYSNISQGIWNQRLNLAGRVTVPGIYLLQVLGSGDNRPATFKLVKTR